MISANDFKIVLLNLPWSKDGRLGVRAGSRWPFTSEPEPDGRIHYIPFPFFLAYATALLKKEHKNARLIDAIAQGMDEGTCIQTVNGFAPDLIIVETSTPSFKNDIRIIEGLRKGLDRVRVGLCGPHAGEFALETLEAHKSIDYVLIGEYEQTLLELVNSLQSGSKLEEIDGLAFRAGEALIKNKLRVPVDNLDIFPWPERDEALIYKYRDGFAGMPSPNVQMLASRGCPFDCTFCLWPQTMYRGSRYRKRNFVDVVDEMEYLIKKFDFKAVYFDDDIFNADREYVLNICREIVKRKIQVPWAAMARPDLMDEAVLREMSVAGLYAIKYGVESADKDILKRCQKPLDLDKVRSTIRTTRGLGIKVHLTLCLGLPGETKQTIQNTVDFVKSSGFDSLQFSLATPFPGTKYFNDAADNGCLCSTDWEDYDGNRTCIVNTPGLSAGDLQKIKIFLDDQLGSGKK